jgi:hypothetical protein
MHEPLETALYTSGDVHYDKSGTRAQSPCSWHINHKTIPGYMVYTVPTKYARC